MVDYLNPISLNPFAAGAMPACISQASAAACRNRGCYHWNGGAPDSRAQPSASPFTEERSLVVAVLPRCSAEQAGYGYRYGYGYEYNCGSIRWIEKPVRVTPQLGRT